MRGLIVSSFLVVAGLIGCSPPFAQRVQKPVCMENPGGTRSCLYDSLAQCQQATASQSGLAPDCVANPERFGTTGQGGMSPRSPVTGQPR